MRGKGLLKGVNATDDSVLFSFLRQDEVSDQFESECYLQVGLGDPMLQTGY